MVHQSVWPLVMNNLPSKVIKEMFNHIRAYFRDVSPALLSGSPQSIPQYIEVPRNIEVNQINLDFSTVLLY
jgi:hypothetical protein